ncbi:MAG: hypothetical protein WC770_02125 [Phycisphaerae bacterium]
MNNTSQERNLRDVIGVSHVIGRYYFTKEDFLNEGADEILGLGSRVIKVWFYNAEETPDIMYPYNSQWPKVSSLVEGAKVPYWKTFFDKPFSTFLIYHQSMGVPSYYFAKGITDEHAAEDMRQTYELAKYFLTEYKNTGKTFIFCSSELDWHIKDKADPNCETQPERFGYTIKWLNARQAGVEKARLEIGMKGVKVFHSAEVVNVMKSMKQGQDNIVNKVLPFVNLDIVGYSAYDSTVYGGVRDKKDLKDTLDYIAKNAVKSKYFGEKNVFIAEYGIPENEFSQDDVKKLTENVIKTGLEWGCPYIVHWQLYCNEPKTPYRVPYTEFKNSPSWNNAEFRGFWLIRGDGSRNYTYNYLKELCMTGKLPE